MRRLYRANISYCSISGIYTETNTNITAMLKPVIAKFVCFFTHIYGHPYCPLDMIVKIDWITKKTRIPSPINLSRGTFVGKNNFGHFCKIFYNILV